MQAIEYREIRMVYGERTVIERLNYSVAQGAFVTIVGSSGGGKTTLLKLVNGLVAPIGGAVFVNGRNTKETDITQLRRTIGYAMQGGVLFPHMTVEENIAFVPSLLDRRDRKTIAAAVQKWMEIVGLEDALRRRYPRQLSGGQQQRVGIARALAASPEILLMDEPFGAVDEITRASLQEEIARIHRETGITILFVTHDINEALRLGTRVLVLDRGEIQQEAEPQQIRAHPANDFVKALLSRAAVAG